LTRQDTKIEKNRRREEKRREKKRKEKKRKRRGKKRREEKRREEKRRLGTKKKHGAYQFPPQHHIPSCSSVSPLSIPPSSLP
jgi:uncharacterized OB-fold protein